MARLDERRRQPYNPYAPGTPTAAAQSRMNDAAGRLAGGAVQGARNIGGALLNSARDISVNNLGGKYTGAALQAMTAPLVRDRAKNQTALDRAAGLRLVGGSVSANENIANPPTAMAPQRPRPAAVPQIPSAEPAMQRDGIQSASLTPDEQSSFVNATVDANQRLTESRAAQPSAQSMGPGSGWIRNESTGEVATMGSDGNISLRDASGNRIDRATGRLGQSAPQQAGNGTQRVGNMDVTFAPETTAEQRQAFLTNPVKPEGQMIQYNNRALAEADRQEVLQSKKQAQGPQLYTLENSPDMGWRERKDYNERLLGNQGNLENTRISGQQNLELEGARSENDLSNSRLLGEDTRNSAQMRSANMETSLKQMEIDQAKNVMALQSQLDDPNLSTEKRKQIENRLYAIQGKPQQKYQITTRKITDPVTGAVTETPYAVDPNDPANSVEIGATGGRAEMLPLDPARRKVGKIYSHSNGKYYQWDGKGLREINGNR